MQPALKHEGSGLGKLGVSLKKKTWAVGYQHKHLSSSCLTTLAILHGLHFSHCSSFSWEHFANCQSYSFLATIGSMGVELVGQPHWLAVCVLWCRTVHDPPSYFMLSQPGCCHDVTLSVYTAALLCKCTEVNVHISMATEAVNNTHHMP